MYASKRVAVRDLNPHILCALCGGYLIQATTVIECLHSFCRTCIVNFLETSKVCPICDAQIHKTRPLLNIRPDQTLQSLVYKLVPGLFQDEMRRRREFHATVPKYELEDLTLEERGEASLEREYKHGDDHVSLALQMVVRASGDGSYQIHDTRYLLCPSEITVRHLKKFIRCKFQLNDRHLINLFRAKEELTDELMLQDIALIYSWRRDLPMIIVYTVREVSALVRHKTQSLKDKVANKQSDVLDKAGPNSSVLNLEPPSIARAQKSSMQEISTESPVTSLPATPMDVTPPVVPSPPLVSPASPSLSSPPLFSPPFFSTPTILPVPFSSQKLPSDTTKQRQTPGSPDASSVTSSAATSHASTDSLNSNTFRYSSFRDSPTNKALKSVPASNTATEEDTTPAMSLSKYCKFSSPSPPTLELGPSVEQICSSIDTSLVSTAKAQSEGSTLGPPLLQSQTATSSPSVSTHCPDLKPVHCSENSSTKSSPQTTHVKALSSNISPTCSQNSSLRSSSVYSKHTAQYPASSSISTSRQLLSQGGIDPNKLMHSVHAILNKSPSKRQVATPPQPSMALRWTPVVEHKSSSISTPSQQPPLFVGASSSNSTMCSSNGNIKQSPHHQDTKSFNSSVSVCGLKAADKVHSKHDFKSISKHVGEVSEKCVTPVMNNETKSTQREAKYFYKTDTKDFLGHSDMKVVQPSANRYNVSSPHKKMNGDVKKVEMLPTPSESQHVDMKSPKDSLLLKEGKDSINKAVECESKKHVMGSSLSKFSGKDVSSFLPQQSLKSSEISVKTEVDPPLLNKTAGFDGKSEHRGVLLQPGRKSELTRESTQSAAIISLSGSTGQQDTSVPFHAKLKRQHSHPAQPALPDKVRGQEASPLPAQSTDDDGVSSYIPKYQMHKALYMWKRSVSCIEDSSAAKTNGNSEQNMEKRNWKKRKLSTLDFDPSSSGFVQKQDKQVGDAASCHVVVKNGATPGGVNPGDSSDRVPRDNNSRSDKPAESQVRHQSNADGAEPSLYADRLAVPKGKRRLSSERLGKPTVVSETAYSTVSCLPITGSIVADHTSPSFVSRELPSGHPIPYHSHAGANFNSASIRDQKRKGMKPPHPSVKTNNNVDDNKVLSYVSNVSSVNKVQNNNNNNNNCNSYYHFKSKSSSVGRSDNIMKATEAVNAHHCPSLKHGTVITASGRGPSQPGNKFTYADVVGPVRKPGESTQEKAQAVPPKPIASPAVVDRTSCISVEVATHSRGSHSDTGSSSSSSTSPAADVTSPGTEDRADNSVMLEMQVAPSCGKTYLSPHCTGSKGLPLDLSSRKRK